jgi:hypothetical protein
VYDPEKELLCSFCVKIVPKPHDCEVSKRMAENPIELDATYIYSDAIPTRSMSIRK